MPVQIQCWECKATLRVRDELAGKKVKCPRCSNLILVPVSSTEEATEVLPSAEAEAITREKAAGAARKKAPPEEEEDREGITDRPEPGRKKGARDEDEEPTERHPRLRADEDEDEEERPRGKGKRKKGEPGNYKPCPQCGATGATRVLWTPWGSFYGPAMFCHVKCPDCGHKYNGRSGRSNLIPAIICIIIPLLLILAILGGVAYIFYAQGYFGDSGKSGKRVEAHRPPALVCQATTRPKDEGGRDASF
jgi:predicted Zn finger-like uncharacterized protein